MNNKIKFNVLDFCIILFAFLVILLVIFSNDICVKFMYNETIAEYTFVATGLTEEEVASIKKDDKLIFSNDGLDAGKLLSFESEKEVSTIVLVNGDTISYDAETYTIRGKVSAKGRIKENGFFISDEHFTVAGKKFNVETSTVKFEMEISDIKYEE